MFSNLLITNVRNIVYELLLNLFAPVLMFLTICILIIVAKLNTFISMKCQSEWDCRSAYDLFKMQ